MKINDNGTIKDLVLKASDTLPIGSIIPFGGTEAPTNWLICDGSMLNREAYPELFNAIGTSFGTDGPNNFYIPDLRGRVIVGQDESDADFGLGLTGGEKEHTLTVDEMPEHDHKITWGEGIFYHDINNSQWALNAKTGGGVNKASSTTARTGGDQPHNNLQPYTVTNYIIKAKQSIGVVGNVVNEKTTSDKDTYCCDYINEKSSYSTEEKVVGEWIDGKPIYRKVIHYSKPTNETASSIPFTEYTTVETVVSVSGISKISGSWRMFPNLYSEDVSTYNQSIYDINETILICYSTWYAQRAAEIYITLEYTKTTD